MGFNPLGAVILSLLFVFFKLVQRFYLILVSVNAAVLDRFTTCNSTIKYKGQKAGWDLRLPKFDKQREQKDSCDLFSGRWVFDNTSYPLYNESGCPYMSDQLACHKHGRPDLDYQYWRWQPHGCNLNR